MREIEVEYNLTHRSLERLMKEYGIPKRPLSHQLEKDLPEEEIANLYTERQWSIVRIAKFYGVNNLTIRRRLIGLGVEIRPPSSKSATVRKPENKKHDLNKDLLEDLIFNQGLTGSEIAAMYDLSPGSVYKLYARYGITVQESRELSEEELREMVKQGLSLREMAKQSGFAEPTLRRYFDKWGIDRAKPKWRQLAEELPEQALRQLYEVQGLSTEEIGRRYGCSGTVVRYLMDHYGIARKK